jgi:hypothetical protein
MKGMTTVFMNLDFYIFEEVKRMAKVQGDMLIMNLRMRNACKINFMLLIASAR